MIYSLKEVYLRVINAKLITLDNFIFNNWRLQTKIKIA